MLFHCTRSNEAGLGAKHEYILAYFQQVARKYPSQTLMTNKYSVSFLIRGLEDWNDDLDYLWGINC